MDHSPETNVDNLNKFINVPDKIKPYLTRDIETQPGSNLIKIDEKLDVDEFMNSFVESNGNDRESLEAILYLLIGQRSGGFYPEQDMNAFREKVRKLRIALPDCAAMVSELEYLFKHFTTRGISLTCRPINKSPYVSGEIQQVFIVEIDDSLAYAVDAAGWYYQPQQGNKVWFHIEQATNGQEALDKLVSYYRNNSIVGENYDRNNWQPHDTFINAVNLDNPQTP